MVLSNLLDRQWRHKTKGGIYEVDFTAAGSGDINGERIVIYSRVSDGEMFARKFSEWHEKMEEA